MARLLQIQDSRGSRNVWPNHTPLGILLQSLRVLEVLFPMLTDLSVSEEMPGKI